MSNVRSCGKQYFKKAKKQKKLQKKKNNYSLLLHASKMLDDKPQTIGDKVCFVPRVIKSSVNCITFVVGPVVGIVLLVISMYSFFSMSTYYSAIFTMNDNFALG